MAVETNVDPGIFKPVSDDYAIVSLERIFGPLVRAIADGAGLANVGSSSTMLEQLIGLMNLVLAFISAFIGMYTIYVATMDTASDGKMMGQSTDSRYTVLRTAIGIVLLLPVKGGFTIAQVIVFYLLVWGSGLADTAWTRVAESNLSGVSYTAPSTRLDAGTASLSPAVTKKFADALRVRTAGYICQHYLNQMATTLNLDGSIVATANETRSAPRGFLGKFTTWAFKDTTGNFANSSNVCGSVELPQFDYKPKQDALSELSGKNVNNFTNTYNKITRDAAITAQVEAVNLVDNYAKTIADHIVQNQRNENWDKEKISEAVTKISEHYRSSFLQSIATFTSQNEYSKSLLDMSTRNGWIFAANWQRMMSNIYSKMKTALEEVNVKSAMPKTPGATFGTVAFVRSTETISFFKEYKEQMIYYDSLESVFDAAAMNKNVLTNGQMQFENGTSIMSWMADTVTSIMGRSTPSNVWSDPLIEIQDVGTTLLTASAAGKAALSVGSFFPNPAIKVAESIFGPLMVALMALGVTMAIIIPFTPIMYYLGAVIGWMILSIEAIFAIPVTIIMCFAPQRQANLLGSNHNVILTLFGLLLRPIFIVTGLIAAYLVIRVGVDAINMLFGGIVNVMTPEGTLSSFYMFIGTIFIYTLVVVSTVAHSCSLITGLSDYVLGWIGVGMSNLVKANPVESVNAALGAQSRLPAMRGGISGSNIARDLRQLRDSRNDMNDAKRLGRF